MASARRAVTPDTLGAWVLKASPRVFPVQGLVDSHFRTVTHRCVRAGYRTRLVVPDQPVLFWVSGGDPARPAGFYAQGRTTGIPIRSEGGHAPTDPRLDLPVALEPLDPPVLREELRAHPDLCRLEVLRMAAGSNPSFVSRIELQELRAQWPHVAAGGGPSLSPVHR